MVQQSLSTIAILDETQTVIRRVDCHLRLAKRRRPIDPGGDLPNGGFDASWIRMGDGTKKAGEPYSSPAFCFHT